MKKCICILFGFILLVGTAIPAFALTEPKVTLQPQNYTYPEYSTAIYTVKAEGNNLMCLWFLEYEGNVYNISDNENPIEPWEGFAGASYGASQNGNTFYYYFNGIESGLNGAKIYCVIEDGHFDVLSDKAIITVSGNKLPPELSVPAKIDAYKGDKAELRCIAKSPSGEQLTYIWYETSTGRLQDIKALPNESEFSDYIICDTSKVGTRYYVCGVFTSTGGMAYSSVVPVNVKQKAVSAPKIKTNSLPDATVSEAYNTVIESSDSKAQFSVYYNPGNKNEFSETGLTLSSTGKLTGTPTKAGVYSFTVCASGEGGEDYMTYTLSIKAPSNTDATTTVNNEETTTALDYTTSLTETTAIDSTTDVEELTEATTVASNEDSENNTGLQVWHIIVIAAAAIVIGVIAGIVSAVVVSKKKSNNQ